MSPKPLLPALAALILTAHMPGTTRAEVVDASANGFSLRHELTIDAPRMQVYRALVDDVGEWWNADHTVSGDAGRLSIDARVQGCFCETLGTNAGLVHLTVSFVNPGVILRLTGGLGPLGLMGVAGNMTFEFDDVDDHSRVTLHYAVGGYQPDGLDRLAPAVDGVLLEALVRLKNYVERGDPLADP
jgi:uncharacterized protein YndB with AHSA1/START domain